MGNNKYKILIVEDEANICNILTAILETNGYAPIAAASCGEAELLFASHNPDLVLLDLGLPDRDGLSFISTVRDSSTVPVIVLSARTTEDDKISALDFGANDYVTKPFSTRELLARVRAALRNNRRGASQSAAPALLFRCGQLSIDYDRRLVSMGAKEIALTQTEYNIVALLSEHAGKVMTYAAIIREVWGGADPGGVKKLQVNMANIRKKLGVRPGEQKYFQNELGVGYRMSEEDGAE